jgi:hypothetical protein
MTLRSRIESAKKSDAAALTAEQQTVLQAIYDYFREHAAWPTFITIDRPRRREYGVGTAAAVQSLPESMIVPPRPGGHPPIASDELRLRLLGVAQCAGGSRDTRPFVEVLHWLGEKEAAHEPQPGSEADMPRVTSAEIAEYLVGLTDSDQLALKRLYEMLRVDNWGIGGFGSNEDSWYVTLTPDVWRFRDVETVEDCIRAREDWLAEKPSTSWVNVDSTPWQGGQITPTPSPYVNAQVIDAIRAKQGQSTFEITKLLGLIDELNDNYARRNSYASHMLLRAVLDHVPPIFGCKDFAEVVNNYSWGRTDKRYIKRLADFRDQADDALHRQVSTKPDVLDFDDMPASVNVDRLLQECAELL